MRFTPHLAALTLCVALTPLAAAATSHEQTTHGQTHGTSHSSQLGQLVATSNPAVTTPPTVNGPTTPTTHEPGDNHPALVIGGGLISLGLIAGGWSVARTRIKDDE